MSDKLLPCPFCGGEELRIETDKPAFYKDDPWDYVVCSCGAKARIDKWNTRINDQWVSVEDACKGKPYQSYLVWRTGDGENYHAAVDYTIDDNWSFSENYDVAKVQLITPPKDND